MKEKKGSIHKKRMLATVGAFMITSLIAQNMVVADQTDEVRGNVENLKFTKVCIGCNLVGADLNRADLAGADLKNADLTGATLFLADLSGADLRGAILKDVKFGGSDLSEADLRGADVRGADLSGAYTVGAIFENMSVPVMAETEVQKAETIEPPEEKNDQENIVVSTPQEHTVTDISEGTVSTEGEKADGPSAEMQVKMAAPPVKKVKPVGEITIAEADLKKIENQEPVSAQDTVVKSNIVEEKNTSPVVEKTEVPEDTANDTVVATAGSIVEKEIEAAEVTESESRQEDISGVAPVEARLLEELAERLLESGKCYGCELSGINLSGKDLEGMDLEQADLSKANLSGTDFKNANLKGVSFKNARLVGAKFSGADLYKADFSEADLTDADFEDAQVDEAIFQNAVGYNPEALLLNNQ